MGQRVLILSLSMNLYTFTRKMVNPTVYYAEDRITRHTLAHRLAWLTSALLMKVKEDEPNPLGPMAKSTKSSMEDFVAFASELLSTNPFSEEVSYSLWKSANRVGWRHQLHHTFVALGLVNRQVGHVLSNSPTHMAKTVRHS